MVTAMTKQQEIDILNDTIKKLGPDSYLGPWFQQIKYELESSIRSDIFPTISLRVAAANAEVVKERAELCAKNIIEKANKESDKLSREFIMERGSSINRLLAAIRRAEKEISDL
jgi:hypothetical protein